MHLFTNSNIVPSPYIPKVSISRIFDFDLNFTVSSQLFENIGTLKYNIV